MKKEKKSKRKYGTNKVILILSIVFAALLIGISVFAFLFYESRREEGSVQTESTAAYTENESVSPNTSVVDSEGKTSSEINNGAEQSLLQEAFQTSQTLALKPYKAIESETGKEISLTDLFGSAYRTYGGELTLTQDGAFSYYIGVSKNGDSKGSYKVEENVLSAVYADGKTAVFRMEEDDGNLVIIVPIGLYEIYFQ